jgi:glucose/arabinose dehydrogenase
MEFTPSIGPAAALFYSGKAFPSMKGNLLVACMRGEAILKIEILNNKINGYSFLLKNKYARIRALTEAPDGSIYFSTSQVDPPESRAMGVLT